MTSVGRDTSTRSRSNDSQRSQATRDADTRTRDAAQTTADVGRTKPAAEVEVIDVDTLEVRKTPSEQAQSYAAPTGATGLTVGDAHRVSQVGGKAAPAAAYDPTQDAQELYGAMHGGLGWGTDEERLMGALDGKSPEQVQALEAEYKDHYDRDLRADIRSELGGSDLQRAEALLEGNQAAGTADRLAQAMDGVGTDEQAVFDALEGKTEAERGAIRDAYLDRHGASLDGRIAEEMGGTDRDRAEALMRGDVAGADAARIRGAIAGAGTDEQAVYDTLAGRSPDERAAISAAYAERYGEGDATALERDIRSDFGGTDRDRALGLLGGRTADADAARLAGAMQGLGTDERTVEQVFEGKSPAERAAIEAAYNRNHGDLDADLRAELGDHDLSRVTSLRTEGRLSAAEQIRDATHGLGTDETKIHDTLRGMSRADLDAARADYQARYGESLDDVVRSELSGRDRFEADLALMGAPETPEQARAVANARYAYEREGPLNAVSNAVVDTFSDAGRVLDRNHQRLNDAFDTMRNRAGLLSAPGGREVERLAGYVNHDVEAYREAEDSVSDGAGTVAATAAGVAVVVGTGGLATPGVLAAAAAAGAGARVATEAVISGSSYSAADAAQDGAVGAVDGGFTVLGAGVGNRVARGIIDRGARQTLTRAGQAVTPERLALTGREMLELSTSQRLRVAATQAGVDGAIGGAAGGAADRAVRDETWDDGLLQGVGRVAEGAVTGLATGAVVGGSIGAASTPFRRSDLGLVDTSVARKEYQMGTNHWRTEGSYDDMVAVNRAVEPTPRKVDVAGPDGTAPAPVAVYGARTAAEADRVGRTLGELRRIGGDHVLPAEVHIRSDVGAITDADGKALSRIAGLGGKGDQMVVSRADLATDGHASHVIHHEVGHNVDFPRRLTAQGEGAQIFGKGQSVSEYAKHNPAEDFAETHRTLVQNWDRIMADPGRYLDPSHDIGRKLGFIAREVYGVDPKTGARMAPGAGGTPGAAPGVHAPQAAPELGDIATRADEHFARLQDARTRQARVFDEQGRYVDRLTELDQQARAFDKPGYVNEGHHDPLSPNFRGRGATTTHLPPDAEAAFERAVPDLTRADGTSWWSQGANGDFYRYQGSPGGDVHWNGATGQSGGGRDIKLDRVPRNVRERFELPERIEANRPKLERLAREVAETEEALGFAELEAVEAAVKHLGLPEQMWVGDYADVRRIADRGGPNAADARRLLEALGINR